MNKHTRARDMSRLEPPLLPLAFMGFRGPALAFVGLPSVAAAPSWHFAILINKLGKILKIFEQLDHIQSWWVLCQH